MKSVFSVLILAIGLSATTQAQQSFQCPKGTEDMLSYFVMAYPSRVDHYMGPGNANPIYTSIDPEIQTGYAPQGTFLWIKSASGYPWDVNTFDQSLPSGHRAEMDGPQHVQATGPGYASDPEMCFHSRRNVTHQTSTQPVHLQLLLQLPVVSDRKSQLCREHDLQGGMGEHPEAISARSRLDF